MSASAVSAGGDVSEEQDQRADTVDACRLRAVPRWSLGAGAAVGELEPHLGSVLVNDAPARGEHLTRCSPKPPGRPRVYAGHRAVTKVLDFDAHDAVDGGGSDLHRRTGGLVGMPDAVGDELGYEQARVLAQLGVPAASSHCATSVRARDGASGPHGTSLGRPRPGSSRSDGIASSLELPHDPVRSRTVRRALRRYGGTGPALLGSCEAERAASKLRLRGPVQSTRPDDARTLDPARARPAPAGRICWSGATASGFSIFLRLARGRSQRETEGGSRARNPGALGQATALQAVSNAMVRLHKEQFGRGPTNARSYFAGPDTLVCTLEDALLPAERTMVEMGEHHRVRESRMFLQVASQDAIRRAPSRHSCTQGEGVRQRNRSRPRRRVRDLQLPPGGHARRRIHAGIAATTAARHSASRPHRRPLKALPARLQAGRTPLPSPSIERAQEPMNGTCSVVPVSSNTRWTRPAPGKKLISNPSWRAAAVPLSAKGAARRSP